MSLQAEDISDELVISYEDENVGLLSGKKGKGEGEVVKDIDFEQEKQKERLANRGSSWYASSLLVVNAALGAGLLNFPQAYDQAGGVLVAVLVQSIFLVFVVIAIFILAYCSDLNRSATYQDVVFSVCGRKAQLASSFTLLVYCYGTCITFLIIIGDQWEEFFVFVAKDKYCKEHPIYMNRAFYIVLTSILLVLPLCFPRRIDFLKHASFIGVLGILYVVIMVAVKYFLPHEPPKHVKTGPDSWMDIFLVVPTICFAYQCHVSIIPIYSCMQPRNLRQFSKTVTVAMCLCVFTYTGTAALGYLMFGHNIKSDILLSFDPDVAVIVAVVLIAIKTYTTYPILLFCGRAAFDSIWLKLRGLEPDMIARGEKKRRIVTTLIWFSTTVALAVFIPNIGVVIQVLGALAAVFIFIFPGMCLLKTSLNRIGDSSYNQRKYKFFKYFSCVFMVMGAFIFGLTLSQALMNDVSGGVKSEDKCKDYH